MTIPKYDEIMPAALEYLAGIDKGMIEWKSLEEPLSIAFQLSEEDMMQEVEMQLSWLCD